MTEERKDVADGLRLLAKQVEQGALDRIGPILWESGKGGLMALGATGEFPEGKVSEDDEGELQLAVGRQGGKVIISFGKAVSWIGIDPGQAEELGNIIIKKAKE